ncbi:hypothetical protein L6R29_23340 [Myxococcota bacterium]|nr:hypothetical protein [Myxococcota bacterium]
MTRIAENTTTRHQFKQSLPNDLSADAVKGTIIETLAKNPAMLNDTKVQAQLRAFCKSNGLETLANKNPLTAEDLQSIVPKLLDKNGKVDATKLFAFLDSFDKDGFKDSIAKDGFASQFHKTLVSIPRKELEHRASAYRQNKAATQTKTPATTTNKATTTPTTSASISRSQFTQSLPTNLSAETVKAALTRTLAQNPAILNDAKVQAQLRAFCKENGLETLANKNPLTAQDLQAIVPKLLDSNGKVDATKLFAFLDAFDKNGFKNSIAKDGFASQLHKALTDTPRKAPEHRTNQQNKPTPPPNSTTITRNQFKQSLPANLSVGAVKGAIIETLAKNPVMLNDTKVQAQLRAFCKENGLETLANKTPLTAQDLQAIVPKLLDSNGKVDATKLFAFLDAFDKNGFKNSIAKDGFAGQFYKTLTGMSQKELERYNLQEQLNPGYRASAQAPQHKPAASQSKPTP